MQNSRAAQAAIIRRTYLPSQRPRQRGCREPGNVGENTRQERVRKKIPKFCVRTDTAYAQTQGGMCVGQTETSTEKAVRTELYDRSNHPSPRLTSEWRMLGTAQQRL